MTCILIVDGDPDTRLALRYALEGEGYHVQAAEHAEAALLVLEGAEPPALIIADIYVPAVGGERLIETMRIHPVWKALPVIQVSVADSSRRAGTRCAIRKPFELSRLLEMVATCLSSGPA